jgi:hypothetical protein
VARRGGDVTSLIGPARPRLFGSSRRFPARGSVRRCKFAPVLAGEKDQAATLTTCSYGNPATPVVNGKPTDVLLVLSVLTDELPNQSKGTFEIAKSNAAEVQMVSGLGEQAFWDEVGRVLRVVKGNHLVEASLGSDLGGLDTARAIMEKMLAKLS